MWIVVISVCSAITMILVLVLCSCWKRERQKNEWLGLDGMVTQMNPDENVNHLPSAATLQCVPNSHATNDDTDSSKRSNAAVNNPTRRSLPDIPSEQIKIEGNNITWSEQTGDNSSELYATVEQCQNSIKRQTLPNGLESRPSISQHSSISQADDGPYAKLNYNNKHHKKEHPYARVHSVSHTEPDENSSDEAVLLSPSTSQSCTVEPVAPPRSRRTSAHSNIDIPAASAVAGGIAANQELPYMTPPITQPNFSGDSQDSSKGYTSISVREPLANIRAQTKEINKLQRDLDPHYSTVSDDSDEMYTTIQDPNNQIYMSGSETYAQIQPVALTVAAEVNPIPCSTAMRNEEHEVSDGLYEPAPQPPSVDSLKHVAHSHSRQASSSSSVGALGSPKPEKRQANSPLPPPPSISPDIHERSKNIDDMYAKVFKNRKKFEDHDLQRNSDRSSIRSIKKSATSPVQEKKVYSEEESSSSSNVLEDQKYVRKEHNYETLRKQFQEADYEKLKHRDEELGSEPGYASINGPDSLLSTDPGYEILKQQSAANSEIDPNYERIRHRTDSAGYSTIKEAITDTYSVVNKQRKLEDRLARASYEQDLRDFNLEEPNYESMPSESGFDHNYAVLKSTDSESDPNYESVKYLDMEPPYERLNEDNSDDLKKLQKKDSNPGYETIEIDTSSGSNNLRDPPYERLSNEESSSKTDSEFSGYEKIQSRSEENDNQIPGYETIKPKNLSNQNKSTSLNDSANKDKSGTNTSDDLPNSDEEIFEV